MRAELLLRLKNALPRSSVLAQAEQVAPYECDGLTMYKQRPLAVVLPEDEAQVQAVLRVCHELRVPVVPRGAGTGLSGGALPVADGIVLSLARLNKILHIDPLARIARLQPGVRNLAISEAAAPHGLFYAPDPSSQIACSIGGNVAENSGGVHCLKYGLTLHNVLSLRVITIDGNALEIGSGALDTPGYDLLALLIGSEGMLAVVTEITVRLLPSPPAARVIMAAFNSLADAGRAVANIIAAGIVPAGLEMMDRATLEAVEPYAKAGYPRDAVAILLCEADGIAEEISEEVDRIARVLAASGVTELRISSTEEERQRLWAGRKAAFPAIGRLSPDYYCMDGTIPRKHLAQVLTRIAGMEAEYGLRCANVFHAGDGNLHPIIMYDANQPGEVERAERFGGEILELCVAVGGTVTGEHGVGVEKINQMCAQFDDGALALMHGIKKAFDPQELLNPGKAVPSLRRCAEYGRVHARGGVLPFPDLPRF